MKYTLNIQDMPADVDERSLRDHVKERKKTVLRDTYYLIEQGVAPSRVLTMGQTVIYPTGSTTGHSHDDKEEVYYVISGEGEMVVGEDRFPVRQGDALYVPPGEFHTIFQKGNLPLVIVWVTGKITGEN